MWPERISAARRFVFTGGSLTGEVVVADSTISIAPTVTTPSMLVAGGSNTLLSTLPPAITLWVRGSSADSTATLTTAVGVANSGTILIESINSSFTSRIAVAAGATFVNAEGGTVRAQQGSGGTRSIIGPFVNEGTISIQAGVTLGVTGPYTQTASGRLVVELASNTVFGVLAVTGVATVGGHVQVALLGGFVPTCFASSTILTASGGVVGEFASVDGSALGDFQQYILIEEANRVRLVATSIADQNQDGALNSDDYFAFLNDYFAGDGDFNDDGVTNSNDYFAFLLAYFAPC